MAAPYAVRRPAFSAAAEPSSWERQWAGMEEFFSVQLEPVSDREIRVWQVVSWQD